MRPSKYLKEIKKSHNKDNKIRAKQTEIEIRVLIIEMCC